jgi:hypothetical protein
MTTLEEPMMTHPHHVGRRQRTERLHILTRSKRRDVLIGWSSEDSAVTESGTAGPVRRQARRRAAAAVSTS